MTGRAVVWVGVCVIYCAIYCAACKDLKCDAPQENVFDLWTWKQGCECPLVKSRLNDSSRKEVVGITCLSDGDFPSLRKVVVNAGSLFDHDFLKSEEKMNLENATVIVEVLPDIGVSGAVFVSSCLVVRDKLTENRKPLCWAVRVFLDGTYLRDLYVKLAFVLENFAEIKLRKYREIGWINDIVSFVQMRKLVALAENHASSDTLPDVVALDCGAGSTMALVYLSTNCLCEFAEVADEFLFCDCSREKVVDVRRFQTLDRDYRIFTQAENVRTIVLAVRRGSLFPRFFLCGFRKDPKGVPNRVTVWDLLWNFDMKVDIPGNSISRAGFGSSTRKLFRFFESKMTGRFSPFINGTNFLEETHVFYWNKLSENTFCLVSERKEMVECQEVSFEALQKKMLSSNDVCFVCSSCGGGGAVDGCSVSSFDLCLPPHRDPCLQRSKCIKFEKDKKKLRKKKVNENWSNVTENVALLSIESFLTSTKTTTFVAEGRKNFVDNLVFKLLVASCVFLFVVLMIVCVKYSLKNIREKALRWLEENEHLEENEQKEDLYAVWSNSLTTDDSSVTSSSRTDRVVSDDSKQTLSFLN